ncbi:MAG: prealbumin-like fold domain-containing protein, partial [archaeon]
MGLKEVYFGMEDKYYAFLDWVDQHGIPVYKVVDAIEAQNIPSFPIAVFSLILILGLLSFVVVPGLFPSGAALTISVQDETQSPLAGVSVRLTGDGLTGDALSSRLTDLDGKVSFTNLPVGETITIIATHEDYSIDSKTIVLDVGENEKTVTALGTNLAKTVQLQLYVANSTESFNAPVSISFACSNDPSFSKVTTVNNGTVSIDVPGGCGVLSAQSSDPTISFQ